MLYRLVLVLCPRAAGLSSLQAAVADNAHTANDVLENSDTIDSVLVEKCKNCEF